VILILADDLRWDALGCAGNSVVQTPSLDRLASRGVMFQNAFVTTSICAVSRASILSGQYQRRHGIADFSTSFTPEAWAQSYPALLGENGYRLGFIGKFGVGPKRDMPVDTFEFWRGYAGQGSYFAKGRTNHLTAVMGDQALEFLRLCTVDRPFSLSISLKAPHVQDGATPEFQYDPRDKDLYADTTIPVSPIANEEVFEALPRSVRESEARTRWKRRFANSEMHQESVRSYYRLVTGIDREVGRILDALDQFGLAENTVVIFTSDNGFFLGERGLAGKWFMYEESIRIPLIICDPRLPSSQKGASREEMVLNIDLAPTILDYAGLKIPSAMQGNSLKPLVEAATWKWRKEFFYEHHTASEIIARNEGMRDERWKYVQYLDSVPLAEELYDLQSDPQELRNLVLDSKSERQLKKMRKRFEKLVKAAE
jgi:arylsulfatase A-like enzyme